MAKLKTAIPAYALPKVVHVDYTVYAAKKDTEDRTDFDGPLGTRQGAARILVENDAQIQGAVERISGLRAGETVHIGAVRVISDNIHTVAEGYHRDSTGTEPPAKSAKKKSKR